MNTKLLIPLVVGLAVSGCVREVGQPRPHFGEAVSHNIMVQAVNPAAPDTNKALTFEGARAGLAQTRYVTDKTEKPRDFQTSGVVIGGGGSSGKGGSGGSGGN